MRFSWVVAAVGLLLGAGCGSNAPAPSKNALVLELGGDNRSLRAELAAAGVVIVPLAPPQQEEPLRTEEPGSVTDGPPAPAPTPVPQPEPAPPVVKDVPTTKLRDGETLVVIARRHLGDGRRWRDLMEWNGWTEAQLTKLPIGTTVKLAPPDER